MYLNIFNRTRAMLIIDTILCAVSSMVSGAILLENGTDYLLLENGDTLIRE